jgi:hypothetical protein
MVFVIFSNVALTLACQGLNYYIMVIYAVDSMGFNGEVAHVK